MSADDVRATTASSYDDIVADFARRNRTVSPDFEEHRSSFVGAVRAGGRVADLGCGPGRDAAHFAAVGLRVVALDTSRQMVRHARGEGMPVAQADIRSVPLRSGSLDGVWSAASLLHVPRPDVPRTLRSWWELLRPSGVLGLSTSLGDDEGWEACPYDASTQPTNASLRRWFVHHDPGALLDLVNEAGFDVVSAQERASHRRWIQVLARVKDPGR